MSRTYSFFVIDDDEDTVVTLAADLRAKGHQVEGFSKIAPFFNNFRISLPDAALVDMVNIEMPGWQICRKIRNTMGLQTVKIIAVSGVLDDEDVGRMNVEADAFIAKPFNADDVEKAMAKLIK